VGGEGDVKLGKSELILLAVIWESLVLRGNKVQTKAQTLCSITVRSVCLLSLSPKKSPTSGEIYSSIVVLSDCPKTISAESGSVHVASHKFSRLFLNMVSVSNSVFLFSLTFTRSEKWAC